MKDDVKVPVQRMVEPELLYSSLFNLFLYKKIGEHRNSEIFGYRPDDRLCAGAFPERTDLEMSQGETGVQDLSSGASPLSHKERIFCHL